MNPLISTILVHQSMRRSLSAPSPPSLHRNGHNEQLPHRQSDSTTCIIHATEDGRTVGAHLPCRLYSLNKSNCSLISRVESFDSVFQDVWGYKSELMDGK